MSTKFVISSELFGGFTVMLNPSEYGSIDNIIEYCQLQLTLYLLAGNMDILANKADKIFLHVHSVVYEDIIKHSERTYFLCECDVK
jgi:hypothetical protein